MEEQKVKNSEIKKIIIIICLIIILSLILFTYNVIFYASNVGGNFILSRSDCEAQMFSWCTDCFSFNSRLDFWSVAGNGVGEALAKCSNNYFQTGWTLEQNCIGNSLDYCKQYIKE